MVDDPKPNDDTSNEIIHDKCGTPDCCQQCDTAENNDEDVKK